MSPLPLFTKLLTTSNKESQRIYFYEAKIEANDVLSLPNPNHLKDPSFLNKIGVFLVTPDMAKVGSGSVIEIQPNYVGKTITNLVIIHKTNLEGVYVHVNYYPRKYELGNPIYVDNPFDFSAAGTYRLGNRANQQYLKSLK